ncbi:MAG: hypothetical protein ACRENE_32300, partial [Polyangiaceae bacterium]
MVDDASAAPSPAAPSEAPLAVAPAAPASETTLARKVTDEAATADDANEARRAFEGRLAREILTAERFRSTLLAVIPTLAMLAFLALSSAYPAVVTELLQGKFDRLPVGFFLCSVAAFEFHVLYATERALRLGTRQSESRRYAYAFIETSLPTLVILYYATIIGPVQALLMPSAFVYFVFIVLSTLRLDFALCTFTG